MKKLFRGHVGEHLLALALALVLWFFVKSTLEPVRTSDTVTRNFSGISIEMRNRPQDMEVVMQDATSVTLTLRGAPETIAKITVAELLAYIDLRSLDEGKHQLSVRVDLPAGVEVTAASPARLAVELERIISSQTTVTLVRSGTVMDGYYALNGTVEPDVVLVTGPRSSIGQMAAFFVVVDISNAVSTLTATVTLVPVDPQGQFIGNLNVTPEQVIYTQPIYRTKLVPVVVVLEADDADLYEISMSLGEVKLAGDSSVLEAIDEIVVTFTLEDLTDGEFSTDIELPPDTFLITPADTSITISAKLRTD